MHRELSRPWRSTAAAVHVRVMVGREVRRSLRESNPSPQSNPKNSAQPHGKN